MALVGLLSVPVIGAIGRLTRLPFGRGTATITWAADGAESPTVTRVHGSVRGFSVSATDRLPSLLTNPLSGNGTLPANGSTLTLPSVIPFGNVKGTLAGVPFTLRIDLNVPQGLNPRNGTVFAHVTGAFRSQPIAVTLTANVSTNVLRFEGTIGTLNVSGVIDNPIRHGKTETARATFDVTK